MNKPSSSPETSPKETSPNSRTTTLSQSSTAGATILARVDRLTDRADTNLWDLDKEIKGMAFWERDVFFAVLPRNRIKEVMNLSLKGDFNNSKTYTEREFPLVLWRAFEPFLQESLLKTAQILEEVDRANPVDGKNSFGEFMKRKRESELLPAYNTLTQDEKDLIYSAVYSLYINLAKATKRHPNDLYLEERIDRYAKDIINAIDNRIKKTMTSLVNKFREKLALDTKRNDFPFTTIKAQVREYEEYLAKGKRSVSAAENPFIPMFHRINLILEEVKISASGLETRWHKGELVMPPKAPAASEPKSGKKEPKNVNISLMGIFSADGRKDIFKKISELGHSSAGDALNTKINISLKKTKTEPKK